MPDPTDPRAVADDPSGIVQQMPEGGDEGLDRLRLIRDQLGAHGDLFMRLNGFYRIGPAGPVEPEFGYRDFRASEFRQPIQTEAADAIAALGHDLTARRATEADLRAEVERLRAQAKGMTALLRAGCDLLAIESEALRNSISIIGDPDRLSDDPEDAPTIETIKEIEDWIASVKATLFPPALSPETDGGQDD